MCVNLRDMVVFLAGFEFFHTLAHIMMPYFIALPIDLKVVVMTVEMNQYAIAVNAIVTIFLLWWAKRLSKR